MRMIAMTKLLPILWIAMLLSVALWKPRHPLVDRWTVAILLTAVTTVHFECRKLALVFFGFAVMLIATRFDAIQAGPFTKPLESFAQFRYPQPKEVRTNDFVDILDRERWLETIDSEVNFFRFLLAILILFGLLSIGDRSIRMTRVARDQDPIRSWS